MGQYGRCLQQLAHALRTLADGLWALHSNAYDYAARRNTPVADDESERQYRKQFTSTLYETEHPVVRVHPETGERTLVLGHFVQCFVGLSQRDSDRLLALFQDHVTSLENTVRWRWTQGDVAIWDNRATQPMPLPITAMRTASCGARPCTATGR